MNFRYVEREDASELILRFLFWAVASILVTRLYLYLSPVKQIAFGMWHIAHVLWGGLFMLVGFLLLLSFNGKKIFKTAITFEGIGWGLFVDEIGKYLTRDNNYWFRPAIIFIYVSFILIFLIYRYFERQSKKSVESKFYDLTDGLEEIINNDLEIREKNYYLKKAEYIIKHDKEGILAPIALSIKQVLKSKKAIQDRRTFGAGLGHWARAGLDRLYRQKYLRIVLWLYTLYWGLIKIVDAFFIITASEKSVAIQKYFNEYNFVAHADIYMISFKIFFDCLAALFFVMGATLFWTRKRKTGLRYYRMGLLVSIFLSSIFKFYFEQFSGVFDLGLSAAAFYFLGYYTKQINTVPLKK